MGRSLLIVACLMSLGALALFSPAWAQSGRSVTGMIPDAAEMPSLADGRRTRAGVIREPGAILALIPMADVDFAEVRAALPGGRVLFLAAIRDFRRSSERMLVLAEPVTVPKGTRIVCDPRLRLDIVIGPPARETRERK